MVIGILGADGTGKSTLIAKLKEDLTDDYKLNVIHTHIDFRPHLERASQDKHSLSRPSYGLFVSVLKMLYRVCKYNAGYLLRSRNSVYIVDRHIYDFSIHFERYRFDARANRLVRFVLKFIPRPNLLIIATGKAETIYGRNKENSMEDLRVLLSRYNSFYLYKSPLYYNGTNALTVEYPKILNRVVKIF